MSAHENLGSAPEILDFETLEELRLLEKVRPGLLDQLMSSFQNKRLAQLAALEQALKIQSWTEIKSLSHSLKGGAGSLGLTGLATLAAELEAQPQALQANPALLADLSTAMELGMNALREWRENLA